MQVGRRQYSDVDVQAFRFNFTTKGGMDVEGPNLHNITTERFISCSSFNNTEFNCLSTMIRLKTNVVRIIHFSICSVVLYSLFVVSLACYESLNFENKY